MDDKFGLVDEKDHMNGQGSDDLEDRNLALSTKSSNKSYLKRNVNDKDMNTINIHAKEQEQRNISKEEQPQTLENVELGLPEEYNENIGSFIQNHQWMWDGHLG